MKVKDLMIPVADLVLVGPEATLLDAFLALEERRAQDGRTVHRDVLVMDDQGGLLGKLTMVDVFRALEPNYRRLEDGGGGEPAMLTREYVAKIFKRYDLWSDTLPSLCSRVVDLRAADAAHVPDESEFVHPDDDLEAAIHRYIMNVRQPLLARAGGRVVGVLRFSDVYEAVRTHILACKR